MNNLSDSEKAPRYLTAETAHIEVYGRMGHLVGHMKNVSQTGAFFELTNGDYVPTDGDILHLTVHLHSLKKTHYVDAEVKWKKGLQFGVHFVTREQVLDKMFSVHVSN